MDSKLIWTIYLQLFNQKLVDYDHYRIIIQDVLINLHFFNFISDDILKRGLKYIHSDYKQYFNNYQSIQKQIFNLKQSDFSYEIILLFSAIHSGGFYHNEIYLLKMKNYMQLRNTMLQTINICKIYDDFENIWCEFIYGQKQKYLSIVSFCANSFPDSIKFYILAFIGYRFFPCGYPIIFRNALIDYFWGNINFERVIFIISSQGNEIQMDAFISLLHVLFYSENISNDEKIFSRLLHCTNSIDYINDEFILSIIRNCICYSIKEFQNNIEFFLSDFLAFSFALSYNIQPIKLPEKHYFDFQKNKNILIIENSLNQEIISKDQIDYFNLISNFTEKKAIEDQQNQFRFEEACNNTFAYKYNDNLYDNDYFFSSLHFQQDKYDENDSININIYEEDNYSDEDFSKEEDEEEESFEDINNDADIQNYINQINELLFLLPQIDRIKFHIKSLQTLLSQNDETFNIDEILEPLKLKMGIVKTSNKNMIGIIKSRYKKSNNVLHCRIARMTKKINNYDEKLSIKSLEDQIQKEQFDIYQAFKSLEPVLQKIILIKHKKKHFDIKSKLFWMNIFCINHYFFELIKFLLRSSYPSHTSIYRWFKKIIDINFWDLQNIEKVPEILLFYSEKLGYKKFERFSLSFDAIKFTPGLQRVSLNEKFYGFITDYSDQGQIDIQKVISKGISPETFLKECCEKSQLGDYAFIFYLSSLDRLEIKDLPIFIYVKKNGFANQAIHNIKDILVKEITSCGFYVPFVFSDGDGIDQQHQIDLQNIWIPMLENNCELILNEIDIPFENYFFNFDIQLNDETKYICITDGMHLLKRIRYEGVIHLKLSLARKYQDSTQITYFYIPELQSIVKEICPSFIFSNEFQTKMDDEYPHAMFERKVCVYLLNNAINNIDNINARIYFKWLIFCMIGGALDIALTGDDELPDEFQFQYQILGFFLMYKIQQNTIPIPKQTRLFTPPVMREYLNLFIAIFREYSNNSCEQALIEKMGSMHLEHFFALIRRYCYYDNHLISVAHSIERIVALRIIQETDEMKWFNEVNRIQLKKSINKKKFKWDWSIASKLFILADDIFESLMFIDSEDYKLSSVILSNIAIILTGNKINDEIQKDFSQKENESQIKLFSISDKSFKNKGSNAKTRLLIGSNGIFTQTNKKEKNLTKKQKSNFGTDRSNEKNYYGPAFNMEIGSNLCFFNQALQNLMNCKIIFKWANEVNPQKLKSLILIDFYFICFDYYSIPFSDKNYIFIQNPPYYSLVNRYFEYKQMKIGIMGDMADVIEYIMTELKTDVLFKSNFEICYKRIEYYVDDENASNFETFILNLSNESSIFRLNDDETNIRLPEINKKEKNDNCNQWIKFNLTKINQSQFIPNQKHTINSIIEALNTFLFPISPQIEMIRQQENPDSINEQTIINSDQIQFCLHTIVSFPQYLFIQINHEAFFDDGNDEFIVDEKLEFVKSNTDIIEYELISLTFFSSQHFYSLHRCWNHTDGPIWVLFNDPEQPIPFHGLFCDALNNFNLNVTHVSFLIYHKM